LRDLGGGFSRSGHRFAICHASTVENVEGVCGLREEEAVAHALDVDTQEVVHRPHVFHGERGLEVVDEEVEEGWCRCRKNQVINVDKKICHGGAIAVDKQ
jgi:hypothetical protein